MFKLDERLDFSGSCIDAKDGKKPLRGRRLTADEWIKTFPEEALLDDHPELCLGRSILRDAQVSVSEDWITLGEPDGALRSLPKPLRKPKMLAEIKPREKPKDLGPELDMLSADQAMLSGLWRMLPNVRGRWNSLRETWNMMGSVLRRENLY
jgi:hypothetical protein